MPSTTTYTSGQFMPWEKYVPGATSGGYNSLMTYLQQRLGKGLTPEEKSYYTGEAMGDVSRSFAGQGASLKGNLARSGVNPSSGASVEAFSDLARGQAQGEAQALHGIEGMDIQQKDANLQNLMKGISIPGQPMQTGSTSTTSYKMPNMGSGS